MSVVTAVKYLAEFAAEALRPWDPSRELAARMLADLPLMVRLREDDVATADEVTYLVLGRFLPGETPKVAGKDYLADAKTDWSQWAPCPTCGAAVGEHCVRQQPSGLHGSLRLHPHAERKTADAAVLVAEAVAVLDEPCIEHSSDWWDGKPCKHCKAVDRKSVTEPVHELDKAWELAVGTWRSRCVCGWESGRCMSEEEAEWETTQHARQRQQSKERAS